MHFEISQIVEASDAGLVLRTLEEQLRDLGKGVERSQNRLMALGIGPSPVSKNIHDRSIFLATKVDGGTKVTVDVNYQASGLLGAAETQNEVVRGKILRALRQTRTELWYRGAGGAPPEVVEAEGPMDAHAVEGLPEAPPGGDIAPPFIVEAPTHGADHVVEWRAPLSGNWAVTPRAQGGISEPSRELGKEVSRLDGSGSRYEHYRMPAPEYPAPVAPLIPALPVVPAPMPSAIYPEMPPPAAPVLAPVVPINVNDMSFVKSTPLERKSDRVKREADKSAWLEWKEERHQRAVRILLMWALGATVVIGWLVGWQLGIWSSPIHIDTVTTVQPVVRPVLQDEQDLWKWLQNWAGAEAGLSPAMQVVFYGDPVMMYFRTPDLTRAGLLATKQRAIEGQDASTELRIEDMKIVDQDADGANIRFNRHFISLPPNGERSDEVVPGTLVVRKVGGKWRIAEEHNADEKKIRPVVKR